MIAGGSVQRATVVAFDEHVGLGQLRTDDGAAHGFHCVAIADGSRSIEVGTVVSFELAAGLHGRWEAVAVRPLDVAAAPGA